MAAEGFRRAEAVLQWAPDASASLLGFAGELARFSGHLERADELKERAIALDRLSGQRRNLAADLADLAEILNALGIEDRAREAGERAYAMRLEIGDPWGLAHARSALVRLALRRGEDATAADMAEESLPVYRAARSWGDLGWECVLAAAAHRRAGRLTRSRELVIEALHCGQRIDEQATLAGALEQAAAIYAAEGKHDEAMGLYGAARRWRRTSEFMFDADDDAVTLTATALGLAEQEELLAAGARQSLAEAADRALAELSLRVSRGFS